MHAVLYTNQLEPITVVDISMDLWALLERGDHVLLRVDVPLKFNSHRSIEDFLAPPMVAVFADRIRRGEHETLMIFTDDEELALLLRADLLPGQHREVQHRERKAFVRGFLKALQQYDS